MDFSEQIKHLRESAGMTQEELASKIGVSRPAVGMWERHRSRPRLDKMNQLADLFGIPVSELLDENSGTKNTDAQMSYSDRDQAELNECWESCSAADRQTLLKVARSFRANQGASANNQSKSEGVA